MTLTRITVTGADDGVDQNDLLALSKEFPFVEWGLLFSRTRAGTPRYPSKNWLSGDWCRFEPFLKEIESPSLRLSAHLCGSLARDVLRGNEQRFLDDFALWNRGNYGWLPACSRIQVNGFALVNQEMVHHLMFGNAGLRWILQLRDAKSLAAASYIAGTFHVTGGVVQFLWDASGGRGVVNTTWPHEEHPLPGVALGRAGGITPDTIERHCCELAEAPGERWIDFESGARTDDKFDLTKVRRALEIAAPYVKPWT